MKVQIDEDNSSDWGLELVHTAGHNHVWSGPLLTDQ